MVGVDASNEFAFLSLRTDEYFIRDSIHQVAQLLLLQQLHLLDLVEELCLRLHIVVYRNLEEWHHERQHRQSLQGVCLVTHVDTMHYESDRDGTVQ